MESHRRIEISTSTSMEDRMATLIAFRERVPIIILREDGTEFARMLPVDASELKEGIDDSSPDPANT